MWSHPYFNKITDGFTRLQACVVANNDVKTTCIAANVILSGEFIEVSFSQHHHSILSWYCGL
jgi:hypothetical protein